MMNIFKALLVCMLAGVLALSGLALAEEESAVDENALATAEEVLAAAGLAAEDLPGVDVDAFVEAEQLTVGLLGELPADALKEALLAQVVPETDSCAYLMTDEAVELAEGETLDLTQVKRIAVVSANDALWPSLMIDLEAGSAYYADGYFFDDIASAARVTDLTDDLRAEVAAAMELAQIDTWQTCYTDSEETLAQQDDEYLARAADWTIAFETESGIVRYSVYGVDTGAPQAFFDLGVALYRLFW